MVGVSSSSVFARVKLCNQFCRVLLFSKDSGHEAEIADGSNHEVQSVVLTRHTEHGNSDHRAR